MGINPTASPQKSNSIDLVRSVNVNVCEHFVESET